MSLAAPAVPLSLTDPDPTSHAPTTQDDGTQGGTRPADHAMPLSSSLQIPPHAPLMAGVTDAIAVSLAPRPELQDRAAGVKRTRDEHGAPLDEDGRHAAPAKKRARLIVPAPDLVVASVDNDAYNSGVSNNSSSSRVLMMASASGVMTRPQPQQQVDPAAPHLAADDPRLERPPSPASSLSSLSSVDASEALANYTGAGPYLSPFSHTLHATSPMVVTLPMPPYMARAIAVATGFAPPTALVDAADPPPLPTEVAARAAAVATGLTPRPPLVDSVAFPQPPTPPYMARAIAVATRAVPPLALVDDVNAPRASPAMREKPYAAAAGTVGAVPRTRSTRARRIQFVVEDDGMLAPPPPPAVPRGRAERNGPGDDPVSPALSDSSLSSVSSPPSIRRAAPRAKVVARSSVARLEVPRPEAARQTGRRSPVPSKDERLAVKMAAAIRRHAAERQRAIRPAAETKINNDVCDACKCPGNLLCCERCPAAFHLPCLNPPLDFGQAPEGEWFCRKCCVEMHRPYRPERPIYRQPPPTAPPASAPTNPVAPPPPLSTGPLSPRSAGVRLADILRSDVPHSPVTSPRPVPLPTSPISPTAVPLPTSPLTGHKSATSALHSLLHHSPTHAAPASTSADSVLPPMFPSLPISNVRPPPPPPPPATHLTLAALLGATAGLPPQRRSPLLPSHPVFWNLDDDLERRNPESFRLPASLLAKFAGVYADRDGDFALAEYDRPARRKADRRDLTRLVDPATGAVLLCYACGGSARDGRAILQCDFCPTAWHLDCLDPPRTIAPPNGVRWRCPCHVEHDLPALRDAGNHRYYGPKGKVLEVDPAVPDGVEAKFLAKVRAQRRQRGGELVQVGEGRVIPPEWMPLELLATLAPYPVVPGPGGE
ncbi:hypothetical protein AMAG_04631 [Allomyces macrogynus ATCC 38327]|uniref:PHD-type domain-containing protein n=1 Tax=Allomyces macrogynus (strain ATCC 38327) TaxID=578462 RepID=A0A0L0S5Y6_ALLM3|nr:hypothetical protein AMAG_04631 [Allomyces macrogynus ATCC 38327]|eukprot:KNE57779.1 hypothetical protein AMAG_04631 [Allomyces macrogynus ATCC 38327]